MLCGAADRLACRLRAQKLEAKRLGQSPRDPPPIRIEPGQMVFPQREQRPSVSMAKNLPHLREELGLRLTIRRIECDNLLKLIKDQEISRWSIRCTWSLFQIVMERKVLEFGEVDLHSIEEVFI